MPVSPPKPCTYPNCHELVVSGRCQQHKRKSGWQGDEARGNRHARGYGARWDKLRMKILNRDSRLCQVCLSQGRYTAATQVDHIIPKAHGGTDASANLQAICQQCHQRKTAREGRAGKKSMGV